MASRFWCVSSHRIASVYGYVRFKRANWRISMYFYQTVHQKWTLNRTLCVPSGQLSYFTYREQVTPNRTPNQYGGSAFGNVYCTVPHIREIPEEYDAKSTCLNTGSGNAFCLSKPASDCRESEFQLERWERTACLMSLVLTQSRQTSI